MAITIKDMIVVGMADLKIGQNTDILTTLGLGSCVGIALYDPILKISGLAHCMLPNSNQIQNNSNTAKFVDTAIVRLMNDMMKLGAKRKSIRAKIAGGAQMFAFNSANETMRIGDRNVESTINILTKLRVPIVGQDTGDTYGRTVELYSDSGKFIIKTIGQGIRNI